VTLLAVSVSVTLLPPAVTGGGPLHPPSDPRRTPRQDPARHMPFTAERV
jgi:hypothetical protein